MHHSARNDQFPFHTFPLAPGTDYSKFTTGCAHYRQLIYFTSITQKAHGTNKRVLEVADVCVSDLAWWMKAENPGKKHHIIDR